MNDEIRDFQATVHCLDNISLGEDFSACLVRSAIAPEPSLVTRTQSLLRGSRSRMGSKSRKACADPMHYENLIESEQCDTCGQEDI